MTRSAAEAFEPYVPGPGSPWDRRHAAHLLRRAGFGGSLEELDALVALGPAEAARSLVRAAPDHSLDELDEAIDTLLDTGNVRQLQSWWILRMWRTKAPFREKQALFLHGHFATGQRKVGSIRWMRDQARIFLEQGDGPFGATCAAVVKGPAMLLYLDATRSERRRPNENLGRELMELFTLGRGNYTEADVKEAARALTGWRVDGRGARFYAPAFDAGEKSILGVKGNFGADDLVKLCSERPACAALLSRKLLQFYATPDPPAPLVDAFATILTENRLSLGDALLTLFASKWFYSDACYRALVKSPAEYAVGSLRALEARVSPEVAAASLAAMGQDLFDPPSVKGWDGGRSWIHAATWLARANFAFAVVSAEGALDGPVVGSGKAGATPGAIDAAVELLLQGDLPASSRDGLASLTSETGLGAPASRAIVQSVLLTPEYHCN